MSNAADRRVRRRAGAVVAVGGVAAALVVPAVGLGPVGAQAAPGTATFAYTGEVESWTVPADVHCVAVAVAGGSGGAGGEFALDPDVVAPGGFGGLGGLVLGEIEVTPGSTLAIFVGQAGGQGASSGLGGELEQLARPGAVEEGYAVAAEGGAGGNGDIASGGPGGGGEGSGGGGGGGASWIAVAGVPVVIGAGGGGGGAAGPGGAGSDGGDAAAAGTDGHPGDGESVYGSGGGAGTSGEVGAPGVQLSAGEFPGVIPPTPGLGSTGGAGGEAGDGGGGGGGGLFGGGGGFPGFAAIGAGGGGGSNLVPEVEGSVGPALGPGDGDVELAWEVGDRSCVALPLDTTTTTGAARPAAVTPRFTG